MSISLSSYRTALPTSSTPLGLVVDAITRVSSPAWRSTALPSSDRDLRLDLFRGLALLMIFIDHIPDNVFGYFTLRSAAFSDAAEVFIFISGFVASLVYGRSFQERGLLTASTRVYKRVWTLYIAHIVLLVLYIAEVSASVQHFGHSGYNDQLHVSDFLAQPDAAVLKAATLQFQPTYLDILPIYILLLTIFPAILWLMARSAWLVLAPSFALYACAQYWHWNLPGFPAPREWYFNPFAWQFMFYLGAIFGFAALRGHSILPRSRALLGAAVIVAGICAVLQISAVLHGIWNSIGIVAQPWGWTTDKSAVAPLRIVNFAALAIIATYLIPANAAILKSAWARPVILCGQHSLPVFCSNILLAILANVVLHEINGSVWTQALVNVAGIAALVGLSYGLTWIELTGGRSKTPVDVAS